jgi:SEC-C motif-containing protein
MRARYSAYALQLPRYLFKTWHKSTRPSLQSLLQQDNTEWLSLKVIKTEQGSPHDMTGRVHFVALYMHNNQIGQLSETSLFEKVQGSWVYVNAMM